jgi:hypothetical protein
VVGERAGEEQRPQAHADAAERRLAGGRLEARAQQRRDREGDGDGQQEPRALQEGEVGVVEVDAEVVGGQRADEQRREEGADTGGGGHPHPLQDVEEELHGPIA